MISLTPSHLTCEYRKNPMGVDALHPRLSWTLESPFRGAMQRAYRISVAASPQALMHGSGDLWDSGKVASSRSVTVPYAGKPLTSGERCYWKVQVWDADGKSASSETGMWQMGLLQAAAWKARWISGGARPVVKTGDVNLPPCPYLRRTFTLGKPIKEATLYATARGMYEMHLNGAKVGDALLTPGWTDYRKRLQYQAYDVTGQVHRGANALGAILGDGWYAGYIGYARQRDNYGDRPALRAQVDVVYTDGTRQTIATDGAWRTANGPIIYSDMLQGESYDARRQWQGWDRANFSDTAWRPVSNDEIAPPAKQVDVLEKVRMRIHENTLSVVADNDLGGDPAYLTPKRLRVDYTLNGMPHSQTVAEKQTLSIPGPGEMPGALIIRRAVYGALSEPDAVLVGTQGPPVRVTQDLKPKNITQPSPGTYIVDLGQNMVGWARLQISAKAGTRVQMRFGEMLNADGTLYTTNLRSARATDTYVCRGGGVETWEPHFTFHGFRYVELTGYPVNSKPGPAAITGRVVGSDTPSVGTFVCSNALVNQLQHNIVWGQRGNFLSVPTDCPQRDERLGWMGDAQIFARTATYNRDVAAFYEKWLQDVEDAQSPEGGFSDVSPRLVDLRDGAPAWGDAGVIVPWTVYQAYGDRDILAQRWGAMTRWMDYITSANPTGLWLQRRNNDFGDWLSIAAATPKDVLATAYYACDAHLMAQMARALNRPAEAAQYEALFTHIQAAFNTAFVQPDGVIQGDTQTCYVLALRFGLLPERLRPLAAARLAANIHGKNDHLSTGFVGVGYLCPMLTENGYNDVAYRLLLQDTFPSWGYSIRQGATTIWERWDGYTQEKGFQNPGMNSFNHYSLGSVGEWLYRYVAGIDTDPLYPGYERIVIHPNPGPGLTSTSATYDSIRGRIASAWKINGTGLHLNVTIPANTVATVILPASPGAHITENGIGIASAAGVTSVETNNGTTRVAIGSGTYHFWVSAR